MSAVSRNRGFTLLELLVVILIIALLATITGIYSGRDTTNVESVAKILMADLRHERSKALVSGTDSAITFDIAANKYTSIDSKTTRQLSQNIDLTILVDQRNISAGTGKIEFYPDGSSSGGIVRLAANGKTMEVTTSWLNGFIHVESAGNEP